MRIDEVFRQLNIVQDFIPATNSNRPATRLRPTYITIHNTDNRSPGADAAAHARYVKGPDARARRVSWHYTVDDESIYQSLPTNEVGWHAGAGNSKSIGIEICMHQGMDEKEAYERAALLVAVLAFQHDIAVPTNIVQHHDWTPRPGKHCPRVLRDKPNGWTDFVARVDELLGDIRSAPALTTVVAAAKAISAHNDAHECCMEVSSTARRSKKTAGRKAARTTSRKKTATKKRKATARTKRRA